MRLNYFSLGSNLGDRGAYLRAGITDLCGSDPIRLSPVYETAPWGGVAQDAFWNLVVELESDETPEALLVRGQRALYHATAVTASNHVVALLAEVESLAASLGLPASTFSPLTEQVLADVRSLGVNRALTGPAARGDHRTIAAHRQALPPLHEAPYAALSVVAARVAGAAPWNS